MQLLLQPSPSSTPPSSQASAPTRLLSPHTAAHWPVGDEAPAGDANPLLHVVEAQALLPPGAYCPGAH